MLFISYYNSLFFNGSMELHVAELERSGIEAKRKSMKWNPRRENYYHTLGCCEPTCSFHDVLFI